MMSWLFFACVDTDVRKDTASTNQPPAVISGYCDEPELSHLPNGNIDCLEDKCFVQEGAFWMGSSLSVDECPVHQVTLDAFYIDAYEVTNRRWNLCVQSGACNPMPSSCMPYQAGYGLDQPDVLPVVCITWPEAATFCSWTGGRLPTEAEWEKASRGTEGAVYAWGSEAPNCDLANFRLASTHCYQNIAPVGYFAESRSAYGLWDTNGNVFEWTSDYYDANFYEESPETNPLGPEDQCRLFHTEADGECTKKVLRGGAYNTTADVIRSGARSFSDIETIDDNIGFRCAYDSRD